jgi:hypothetical protein
MIIRVRGIPPYDGDYPFDPASFTVREHQTVRRISGLRPLEWQDGFDGGDAGLVAAFIVVAVQRARAGEKVNEDAFLDSDLAGVQFDAGDVEATPDPTTGDPDDSLTPSGLPGRDDSAPTLEATPFPTGTLLSASSVSRPIRSAG